MAAPLEELQVVRELRARSYAEGGVFWIRDGELAVFDPHAAHQVNACNFGDLIMPDKLADVLRGRTGEPVSWKQIRAAWMAQLRRMSDAEGIARLAAHMSELLDERLGRPRDLVWAIQEVCTQALVPVTIAGLSPRDTRRILLDQTLKLKRLLTLEAEPDTLWKTLRFTWAQVAAGGVARRELRGRAKGSRPRQLDLTDPVVDLLPVLGLDRAVDAVTTILTAISGPPGSAAVSLAFELTHRPEWAARLTAELAPLSPAELYAAPTQAAPVTHRFVKEVLRLWSPPVLMSRPVRTDIDLEQAHLETGQRYLLSTLFIHHDPRHWKDPEVFDPDRWLAGAENGPCRHAYVPFGWSPRSCIGASLGTAQLILLCHLLCTRYEIELQQPDRSRMALGAVPLPLEFQGTIRRRAD
jgi:cytochrome P450